MSRIGIAALLFGFAVPASASSLDGRPDIDVDTMTPVIGGTAVPAGKWPDTVAVLGQGACTGTLIAPDVVLTAGHCADMQPTQVIANTLDYSGTGGITATVKSVTAYPNWETSYDVAVIVLNAPITGVTPRKIGTACTFTEGFAQSTMVRLVGFGLTDTAGAGNNTKLNEAMAPVSDPACTGPGGCVTSISPGGEFIAGGGGKDSCFGDSGGPVYLETARGPVVIGAVSRGLDGAATPCGGGGIYVRTDKIVQWIEQTAGKPVEKDLCAAGPGGEEPGGEEPGGEEPGGGEPGGPSGLGGDLSGGCSSSSGSSGLVLALFGFAFAFRRRRS
ncbi:MAG: trypsin-like serine protease [Deltaproteobacteria bacterium]|nr:trypsin-like serine protease [Deltaproteobacteria bacterium]